jgi:energy-converting hydrogenase B subunit D
VTTFQVVTCVAVAIAATAAVAVRDPLRQAIASGFMGLVLAAFFIAYGAPDVALSQIVVGSIAVPAMILLALAKLAALERDDDGEGGG